MKCEHGCYEIGGEWIMENPRCPVHGQKGAGEWTELGIVTTPLGDALRVRYERADRGVASWAELQRAFSERYPGKWGVMLFPPAAHLFDQANRYWWHVLDTQPGALDLFDDQPAR